MTSLEDKIRKQIAQRQKELKLSTIALATMVGISKSQMYNFMARRTKLTIPLLQVIVEALSCTIELKEIDKETIFKENIIQAPKESTFGSLKMPRQCLQASRRIYLC